MNETEFNRITDVVKSLTLYNVKTEMVGEKMLITVPDGIIALYQINKLQIHTAHYSFIINSVGQALTITLW